MDFEPVDLTYTLFEPVDGADESLAPIIFLHGMTLTKNMWLNLPQTFANQTKRKAYAVDARNHGDSKYTDSFSFDHNAWDLLHFMDSINASKAILIGASMGAVTAIQTALLKPEKVEKLVSEDMFVKKCPKEIIESTVGFIHLWNESIRSIPKDLDIKEATAFAIDYMYDQIPTDTPYITSREDMHNMGLEIKQTFNGEYGVTFNNDVILEALKDPGSIMSEPSGKFEGPALFVYGELSPFCVGKEKEHIKQHFPRAEFVEFKGGKHTLHSEQPEKFLQTTLQFLLS